MLLTKWRQGITSSVHHSRFLYEILTESLMDILKQNLQLCHSVCVTIKLIPTITCTYLNNTSRIIRSSHLFEIKWNERCVF